MSGKERPHAGITRRSFLKTTGALAGATALAAAASATPSLQALADDAPQGAEEVFSGSCRGNCLYACKYDAHVRNGKLVGLVPSIFPEHEYTGGCLRGVSYMERIYGANRIMYPMRRVGERGSGEWERISWDEALREIKEKLTDIIEEYGPHAVALDLGTGNWGLVGGTYGIWTRLVYALGLTKLVGAYDNALGHGINRVLGTGEGFSYCNEPTSVLDSSLVVIWGGNPVYSSPQTWRHIQQAKERGTKLMVIDPVKSASAYKADEWICITPGTDAYLALAICNYLIENDLYDHAFVASMSTAPFLVRRDTKKHLRKSDFEELDGPVNPSTKKPVDDFYVWDNDAQAEKLITEASNPALEGSFEVRGIPVDTAFTLLKAHLSQYTIEEAAKITGVPEKAIVELANEFATQRAISINATFGTNHYLNGHLSAYAMAMLLALTGNYAKPGAGFTGIWVCSYSSNMAKLWTPPSPKKPGGAVPTIVLPQVVAEQELEGKPRPLKAVISTQSNLMSSRSGQNDFFNQYLPNIDYWVVIDMDFTDTTDHADLILPAASWYEQEDLRCGYNHPYLVYQEKAIEPVGEAKSEQDICSIIGRALGAAEAFPEDYTFDDWARIAIDVPASSKYGVTLESLKEKKAIRVDGEPGKSVVRGSKGFATESGRVQLYCENPTPRSNYGQDLTDVSSQHLPFWREPGEASKNNPLYQKYPLFYIQEHTRWRTHSMWHAVPILKELDPEPLVKLSAEDAAARDIGTGDVVEVFNDRGHVVLKAQIDESVVAGVVVIPKGWQRKSFIKGGYQELTNPSMDPSAVTNVFFDALVDVRKWEGE